MRHPPPIIRSKWTSYGYHMYIFTTILRLNPSGLLGSLSWRVTYYKRCSLLWRNDVVIKNQVHKWYKLESMSPCASGYILYSNPLFRTEVCNWWLYVDTIWKTFQTKIFNLSIIFIWINDTYVILNLYQTTLYIYLAIGKTLFHQKWSLIWRFIFVFSVINEH